MEPSLPVGSLCLLAPPLDGPATGGTLYNRGLLAALQRAGRQARALTLTEPMQLGKDALLLVDSLYLDRLPELRARLPAIPTWLLLHYLPAQVRYGRAVGANELSAAERGALAAADGFIVTSEFMAVQLAALGIEASRVQRVEPGVTQVAREPVERAELRALIVGAVTEGKGLLSLLRALAPRLRDDDRVSLEVVGSLDAAPEYAAACRELIGSEPELRARVCLLGALPHEGALGHLARAGLLVSASRMESYGMALSEARAAGVPIVALSAGNVFAHVDPSSGGVLCSDAEQLAAELLLLARAPNLLAERDTLARAAIRARSWDQAASELTARLKETELNRQ